MEDFSHVWSGGSSVAIGLPDRMQSRTCGLINDLIITSQLPTVQLRRDVASLPLCYCNTSSFKLFP